MSLTEGTLVDRYGPPTGVYFSPRGTPFPARALPSDPALTPYTAYRVLKPFDLEASTIAPAFGQPGGGVQYLSKSSAADLVKNGFLEEVGK